ncbi:MAG: sodium:proton antiporter, partial [Phycisphaerae bacterium]|nr:sodium:proton antiporter [Phycisphaerae bacterium]
MSDTSAQSIALALGVSALITVACRRIRIPALLPLLLAGFALGTSGLNAVDASSMGSALTGFITVAIGLLIFEGALHLNRQELARAPNAVWGLLTIGAVITWVGSAAAAHLLLDISLPTATLLGAALIVTGPTVVQPILRLVRLTPRLHTVLAAEAVLIDPIGVVATVTTLEILRLYALGGANAELASHGAWIFAKPFIGGAGVGVFMGLVGYWLLRAMGRSGRPDPQLLNLVAIGVCMTCVGIGEAITPEAGLAAVTIRGVAMARAKVLGATELRAFKELLAVILVGTLFILLASRFDVASLRTLTWREGAFVLLLIVAIRPVSVMTSTFGSKMSLRERIFASTFAPRGIVALSVVTIATAELAALASGADTTPPSERALLLAGESSRLELIMFVAIAGTVLLASTVSPVLAWLLGVKAGEGTSVLLVGAHSLSVELAKLLSTHGVETRVVDSNEARVAQAAREGVDAVAGDATDARWMDDVGAPHGIRCVITWTGNHDVDQLVTRWAEGRTGEGRAGVWSNKPIRGALERGDIGMGEPIAEWIERLEDGKVSLLQSTDAAIVDRLLGWVQDGRF